MLLCAALLSAAAGLAQSRLNSIPPPVGIHGTGFEPAERALPASTDRFRIESRDAPLTKGETVLGKLGITLRPSDIFATRERHSKRVFRTDQSQYLILTTPLTGAWKGVLLENGSVGYMRSSDVESLPYEVVRDKSTLKFPENDDLPVFTNLSAKDAGRLLSVGVPVKQLEDLKEGDRLFFWSTTAGRINATGIYLGNGYFVGGGKKGARAQANYLGDKQWRSALVAARRT